MPASPVVLLPGTGSDEVFVRSVFAGPLASVGLTPHTPTPPVGDALACGYLAVLDRAAEDAGMPIVVGGISFGAHLAAEWATRNPAACAGLLLAMPAWNGPPGDAPASHAARHCAELVDRHGLDAALARCTEGVPGWLATELDRAWRRHGAGLAAGLRAAGRHPGPDLDALATLPAPTGIATCVDDPVHPADVAWRWAAALPRASVVETTLSTLGADRESLGRATVLAWLRARSGVAGIR
ncbi:alpha/beta hydrolase [Amycolatopsis antarctica]|uniref:Alpha/beta hydrolase n=2 Tax=Amycolatopsis antarctica TaxID=1854586 RepID=A0A263D8A3_9PSEU|nr:alpha/beta hydrolase [Amycolatopsis antarctica]